MRRLIYYPGFESNDENWLKFALLYVDKLSPILPIRADAVGSERYKMLSNETDILISHRPGFQEGYRATLDAIDIVERIAASPSQFDIIFNKINVIKHWKESEKQTYTLYNEKFSSDWAHYCIENGYGQDCNEGLRLSESLAVLYMTILANRIADEKNISIITDYQALDDLSFLLKKNSAISTNETVNAKGIISVKLPSNIDSIGIDKIIQLRNSKDFKQNQAAFHNELSGFLAGLESGDHTGNFIKKYEDASVSFTEQIMSISADSIGVGIGTWMLLNTLAPGVADLLKLAASATGIVIKQGFSINKTWKNSQSERSCRRYLSSIQGLPSKKF